MGSIGTFGSFTQARLGIYAAQQGMSVTGNNISNINTPGYTRQRLDQVSIPGSTYTRYAQHGATAGYGALVTGISQLRDPYLDIRFRDKNADVGAMGEKLDGLNAINDILNEVGKGKDEFGIIGAQFDDLIHCLEQLSDQTGQDNHDNLVRGSAEALCRKLNAYANELKKAQENVDHSLRENVKGVNDILISIRDLNESIRKCDIHGDPALELRDRRNVLIDQLSGLIKIDVTYEMEDLGGGLQVEKLKIALGDANPDNSVTTDSTVLVDGVYAGQLQMPDKTPMINPSYDPNAAQGDEGFGKYLKLTDPNDPTSPLEGTNEKTEALMVDNTNYDMGVSELVDKFGATLFYISKLTDQSLTFPTGGAAADQEAWLKQNFPGLEEALQKQNKALTDIHTVDDLKQALQDNPTLVDPDTGEIRIFAVKNADAATGEITFDATVRTPSKAYDLDDNDLYGAIQSQREFLTEKGEFSDKGTVNGVDEGAAGKRGVQFYQRALDSLARQVADTLNAANKGFLYNEKGEFVRQAVDVATGDPVMGPDGKPVYEPIDTSAYEAPQTYRKTVDGNFVQDPNGTYYKDTTTTPESFISSDDFAKQAEEAKTAADAQDLYNKLEKTPAPTPPATREPLVSKHAYSPAEIAFLKSEGAVFRGGNLFSNRGDNNDGSNITAANISIAHDWSNGPMIVRSFLKPDAMGDVASTDSSNITHILTLFDTKLDYMPGEFTDFPAGGGESMFHGTFTEMWNKVGTTLGDDMKFTDTMMQLHYKSTVDLDMQRDSVSSVDLNDEAMNLMQYSKSYNAACRLMTTIDSMIDKLINGTGMTT